MQTQSTSPESTQHMAARAVLRMRRILLACLGVLCVGLAAVGVVLPGMPTTIFLILATACFMRSCPWLQTKLIENRFFGAGQGHHDLHHVGRDHDEHAAAVGA